MKALRSIALALLCAAALACAGAEAGAQNLITNGDMEGAWTTGGNYTVGSQIGEPIDGCYPTGWTPWNQRIVPDPGDVTHVPIDPKFTDEDENCGNTPTQNHFQRITCLNISQYQMVRGGLVQAVQTVPGQDYDFDAQVRVNSGSVNGIIGFDLTGQTTDPLAETIVWMAQNVPTVSTWEQYSMHFTAQTNANGDKTSVWIKYVIPWGGLGTMDVDNVAVTATTGPYLTITDGPYANRLSDTSYEIVWTTNIGSDSTVQYGVNKPDNDSKLTPQEPTYAVEISQSGITTTHSVVVSGLAADQPYHYRVKSALAGSKTTYSIDYIFTTPEPPNSTFQNGDFEITDPPSPPPADGQKAPGWTMFSIPPGHNGVGGYQDSDGIATGFPPNGFGNWNAFAKAQHGSNFILTASNWGTNNGGFYQRVAATPGQTYTVSGYVGGYTYSAQWDEVPSDVTTWVGIDPNGGIDPTNPGVVWNPEDERYGDNKLLITYVPTSVSATAASNVITVFIRFKQNWAFEHNVNVADNFTLQGPPGQATQVSTIGDAKALQDGTLVEVTSGMIVTLVATYPESGLFYMQDAGGNAGIRVETNGTAPAVGDKVLVKGVLGTNPNGERVLRDAIITPNGAGTTVIRTMANKSVGGAGYIDANLGLGTQGLLVRVCGKITKYDVVNGYMIIDDGSNMNPLEQDGTLGLKVVHSGYFPGSLDEYLSVTGVVTSEQINGQNIRVIRGRDGLFPSDIYDLKQ